MPIYEYECPKCGVFEKIETKGKKKARCPSCGKDSKKIISHSNFRLKWDSWSRDQKAGRVRDE